MNGINRAWLATTFVVDASLVADYTSAAIDCTEAKTLCLQWQWLGTSTPNGVYYVEASGDNVTWYTMFFDANKVYGTTFTHPAAGGTTITVNSASAGTAMVIVENPPPYVRLFWDRTSGGAAAALDVQYAARPV